MYIVTQVTGVMAQYASVTMPAGTPPIRAILGGQRFNSIGVPTNLTVVSAATPGAAEVQLVSRNNFRLGITGVTDERVILQCIPYGFRPEPIQSVERTS